MRQASLVIAVSETTARDLLVQPSTYEGFGMPVIEAMACGLPVVCSDGGALLEIVADAALVVPLDRTSVGPDAAAFAAAVSAVLSDTRLAARLRAAGLERALAFRTERVAPALFDAYRVILAPARETPLIVESATPATS